MHDFSELLRALPETVGSFEAEPPPLRALSDVDLVRSVASAISRPKRSRSGSFIIHAPLELLARAELLRLAPVAARRSIRLRLAAIAAEYAAGEEVDPPRETYASSQAALEGLAEALTRADPEAADSAICTLIQAMPADALIRHLADLVVGQLGLAAHAPILLGALPDAQRQWGDLRGLLRAPIRALARDGHLKIGWIDGPSTEGSDQDDRDLFQVLSDPGQVRSPSLFIAPTMLAVDAGGYARRRLLNATSGLSLDRAGQILSRVAALAMLGDDPDHAPFGWTHCLSMPQGVISLARYGRSPERFIRVAATHALGFRATLGKRRLEPHWGSDEPFDVGAMVSKAGAHHDAHLAKYTLACLRAAEADPEARSLYLGAARYLADWWDQNPDASFGA